MSDSTNYGDAATASELLRLSVYDLYGVDEEQLLCPRSRKEVTLVLVSGVSLAGLSQLRLGVSLPLRDGGASQLCVPAE